MNNQSNLLEKVKNYYSEKIVMHGATSQGVDWNSVESQELRFQQLLKLCKPDLFFSINDLGCGFGALYQYMQRNGYDFTYAGFDISEKMIQKAQEINSEKNNCLFELSSKCMTPADYSVASGIFNVKLENSLISWEEYILSELNHLNDVSTCGFAFNCLTKYSDNEYRKDYLYYADPCFLFDYCKKKFSKNVALLHDYNLYEFTILVRKE